MYFCQMSAGGRSWVLFVLLALGGQTWANENDRIGGDLNLVVNDFKITGFGMSSSQRGIELCVGKNGKPLTIEYPIDVNSEALLWGLSGETILNLNPFLSIPASPDFLLRNVIIADGVPIHMAEAVSQVGAAMNSLRSTASSRQYLHVKLDSNRATGSANSKKSLKFKADLKETGDSEFKRHLGNPNVYFWAASAKDSERGFARSIKVSNIRLHTTHCF